MNVEEGKKASPSEKNTSNGLSPEEELRQLREQTEAWKRSVAVQLNEASKKNKQLREEREELHNSHEKDLAALRVQLDKEFRERAHLKDEEIKDLQRQMKELREEKRHMAEEHEKDLERAVARIREDTQMENMSKFKADKEQHEAEIRHLREIIDQKENAILQAEHEAAVMGTRLERLGEQYRELSSLMTNDEAQAGKEDGAGSGGGSTVQHALKLSDAAHKQQLETARSELRSLEEKYARKLREAERAHEVEKQRLMDEMYRGEEQRMTLQALLQQTRHEAESARKRIAAVRAEKERSEQRLAENVAALSKELANRMEESQGLTVEVDRLKREVSHQESLVYNLEEDARIREEAFTSLTLSEDNRHLVQGLQEALQESREETELWRQRYEEILHSRTQTTIVGPFGEGVKDTDRLVPSDLAQREEALAAEAIRLESKARLLKSTEVRLEELKRSIASQASVILHRRGDSNDESKKNGGRVSDTERRGGMFLASPRRYMQMIREKQGHIDFFFLRRLVLCILSIRLRTLLSVFLFITCTFFVFLSTGYWAVPPK